MRNSTINCLVALLFWAGCGDSTGPGRTPPEIIWEQTNAWEQNAPNEAWVTAFAINSSGNIFAGTIIGVFRSTDSGDSWTAVNTGLTYLTIYSLAINPSGEVFAATGGGVFRSTDNGDNWTAVNTGLTNLLILSLAINSSGNIFAGTSDGVFRSTDNGDNWTKTGLRKNHYTLAINSSDHIFAGGNSPGVFRSTDNGDNWTEVNKGLPGIPINSLAINSTGDIFVSIPGFPVDVSVFRSRDNGDSWTKTGLHKPLNTLALNSSDHIFAGGASPPVFRSTDNGDNWTDVSTGLTASGVTFFAFNPAGQIFAGTRNGVFRSVEPTI